MNNADDMTARERFVASLTFARPDKYTLIPGGPRESTLQAWRQQGLPAGADWHAYLLETLGIPQESTQPRLDLGVSFKMIPTFEEKVLEHKNGHYIVQDWMGAITEISDQFDYTYIRAARDFVTRKWHSFPVTCRQDWEEKIRWRYDPDTSTRFPDDFAERCRLLRERDYPLAIGINGPFWQMREWCGFEGLCMMLIEDPELVHDMAAFWTEFVMRMLEPILEQVAPDYIEFNEDMAYKAHSMISPAMTRAFLLPSYRTWVPAIKASGCPIVSVDSDGYIAELIPLWVEVGINCTRPLEVAAHNDVLVYRREFGTKLAYRQAIDKRCVAVGGDVMRNEVFRVVPPLLREGGFIPGVDHGVPPDISWPNFVAFTRLLAEFTGWL
jgi:uroporphyrinogen-III decarboxylase